MTDQSNQTNQKKQAQAPRAKQGKSQSGQAPKEKAGPPTDGASLLEKMRKAHVSLREDLKISRHVFRGRVSYIVFDPVNFRSQRFDIADYQVLCGMDDNKNLADCFKLLVEEKKIGQADEVDFYKFILNLHRLGFLSLPIRDHELLYEQAITKEAFRQKQRLMSFLFLKIPLWNPDRFLDRTMPLAKPFFTLWFMPFYLALMAISGWIVWARRDDFLDSISAAFSGITGTGIVWTWVTLIILKIFHEFGHAYACKSHGGVVPEMGAFFLIFTPAAYMDASSSWSFNRISERLSVSFAGVYIESIIAAFAVLLWSVIPPGFISLLCVNIVLMATVTTIGFNLNPLVRFDGYFALSDIMQVPNLQKRSFDTLQALLKRCLLGMKTSMKSASRQGPVMLLLTYAASVSIYRVGLYTGIAATLVAMFGMPGIVMAVFGVGIPAMMLISKILRFLIASPETQRIRLRCAFAALLLIALPVASLFKLELPGHLVIDGILGYEKEAYVHSQEAGFLIASPQAISSEISAGDALAILDAPERKVELIKAVAAWKEAQLSMRLAHTMMDPIEVSRQQELSEGKQEAIRHEQNRIENLAVKSPISGKLIWTMENKDIGQFIEKGQPLARIADGKAWVRALMRSEELVKSGFTSGAKVWCKSPIEPRRQIEGEIIAIEPVGSRQLEHTLIGAESGIPINPVNGETLEPYFIVRIELKASAQDVFRFNQYGARVMVRLDGAKPLLGEFILNKAIALYHQLQA